MASAQSKTVRFCRHEQQRRQAVRIGELANQGCRVITYGDVFFTQYEFDWDKTTETSILSGFYYGYIWTQVLGGYLSDRYYSIGPSFARKVFLLQARGSPQIRGETRPAGGRRGARRRDPPHARECQVKEGCMRCDFFSFRSARH